MEGTLVEILRFRIPIYKQVFACRSATVHEEAILTIGALVYATSGEFAKYMPEFYKSCFAGDLSR